MQGLFGRLLSPWVRATLRPEDIAERLSPGGLSTCYVLELRSGIDLAVLQAVCVRTRLPRPGRRLLPAQLPRVRSALALSQTVGLWRSRIDRRPQPLLRSLIETLQRDATLDVSLVPTAVYWGRAPSKEKSVVRRFFSDDWALGSRLHRFMTVLFNGRNVTVQLGDPVSLRSLIEPQADTALNSRRVARLLRLQLSHMRTARIGPDLSHRRTIVTEVLRTRAVRAVVAQMVRDKNRKTRRAALLEARSCATEIAANYSPVFVVLMEHVLTWLWNRLYDGIDFQHVETLQQVADGHEIIYVPCHRSHMDYLLLSYAIYQRGYAAPHVAAGINLNLPVVGRFLRKGGAFFIRRSFRGSSLYTVVFMQYLSAIMARGHSIEYFIEGGRSRTGRLLPPMTGMLSMTVRSYLREPRRPVVFMPVYFGYERVVELATYVGELSGQAKQKESIFKLISSAWRLLRREKLGRVHVNFGEPIDLDALLGRQVPDWRKQTGAEQTPQALVARSVDELAPSIMRNINAAAALTPINLLALVLLATPHQAMLEGDLERQIETLMNVMRKLPYSDRVTLTDATPARVITYGIELKIVSREHGAAGDIVRMTPEHAVLAAYYRNNVLHLFAMPSLVACCFLSNASMLVQDVQRLVWRIYPYIASELFLRWPEEQLPMVVEQTLFALGALGMLQVDHATQTWVRPPPASAAAMQLSSLAQSTLQTVERYYLAIALLIRAGSGQLTQRELEERCQQMAQRITMIYGFNSPEFFDRRLFGNFIDLLRERAVVGVDTEGRITFNEVLERVADDAQLVLSEQIRHSILQVTLG